MPGTGSKKPTSKTQTGDKKLPPWMTKEPKKK